MRLGCLGIVWAGCAGDEEALDSGAVEFPRACDESAIDGDCVEFSGGGWTGSDVTGSCSQGGDLLPACPPGGAVGTCTLEAGGDFETVTTFYSGFWQGPDALQQCNGQGGAWAEL